MAKGAMCEKASPNGHCMMTACTKPITSEAIATNADHIRAMSDEELAMYFAGMADEDIYNDPGAWLAWLQNSYGGGET